jgi:hypothetical protein
MMAAYEASTRDFIAMVQAHRAAMPTFHADAYMTDDLEYLYTMPISGFAQMDALMGEFMAMEQAGGDGWRQMMQENGSTMVKVDEWIVLYRPDLSYVPEQPRLKDEEIDTFRWEFYYLQPESGAAAEQLAKDIAAFYRERGISDPFHVFQAVMGGDLPFLVVSVPGKDEADIHASYQKVAASVGDAWAPYEQRIMQLIRRMEVKTARMRPDLSIARPEPPAAAAE